MTGIVRLARDNRLEAAVVLGAAAILLAVLALVGSSLVIGIAQAVREWHDQRPPCPSSMSTVVMPHGGLACLPPGTRPPRGWSVIEPAH